MAALVIGLALLCTAAGLGYAVAYARPRSGEAVTVVVEQGATARRIGALLEKAGLAPDAFLFDLAARLSGKAGQLKAGEYRIVKGTGIMHIVGAMARGEVAQVRVTLAEGLTAAQMAQALERAGVTGADKFMEIVNAPPEWVHAEFSFVEPGASLATCFPIPIRSPRASRRPGWSGQCWAGSNRWFSPGWKGRCSQGAPMRSCGGSRQGRPWCWPP